VLDRGTKKLEDRSGEKKFPNLVKPKGMKPMKALIERLV
jgi:hypothetical protein